MKYINIFFFACIAIGTLTALPVRAEWTFDECGRSELDALIDSYGESIYNCSYLNGSGKNDAKYKKIIKEYVEKIKVLLQKESTPINHQSNNGQTPLMGAAYYSSWEIIELLLQAGANTKLTDKHGLTALHYLKLSRSAHPGSIMGIGNFIMQDYKSKKRYNKCADLLMKSTKKGVSRKR